MTDVFNPLDLQNLGESISRAMAERPAAALDALPRFQGTGIYALYYDGDFPAYRMLVDASRADPEPHPIYVGQAVGPGSRKGVVSPAEGSYLRSRLAQHAKSIEQAKNLNVSDFVARWLVLDEVWVNLGESVLIKDHSPVWNSLVEGFGNHDPGKGRHAGARPRWDILHPGRVWADRLGLGEVEPDAVGRDVEEYLRQRF